jgi:hypothetical protein
MSSQQLQQQYHDDMINPYAVSRKYHQDELNFVNLSQSAVGVMDDGQFSHFGQPPYRVVPTTMAGGPPPYQWSDNVVLSQQSGFTPQMRNSYRYHSFQGRRPRQTVYNQYSQVNAGSSQTPPLYLHPPSYAQSPSPKLMQQNYFQQLAAQEALVEDDARSNVSRGGYNHSRPAPGKVDNHVPHGYRPPSRADDPSKDNSHHHGHRPPSRADAGQWDMLSPDQSMLPSPEPFPLSQPVSSKPHPSSAFNPTFRRSLGPASANRIKPISAYSQVPPSPRQYYANRVPNIPPEKQTTYVRYQGFPQQQRKPPRPRAQTPIVLTTPAGSSSVRRSQEALIEERDDDKVSYYVL